MRKFSLLCAALILGALVGRVAPVMANGLPHITVSISHQGHPLFGEEITITADIGNLTDVTDVIAHIEKGDGVAVDINGSATTGTDLTLTFIAGTTRYERPTAGLNALTTPMRLHLTVTAKNGAGTEIGEGPLSFSTTNLRIEDSNGNFKQIFAPGNVVKIKAKVPGGANVAADVKNIYTTSSAATPVSLSPIATGSSIFTGDFDTSPDGGTLIVGDFLVNLFKDRSETATGTAVPIDGIIPQFTTDPIKVSIGDKSGASGSEVVVPVNIGDPDATGDNVTNKGIIGTSFEIGFETNDLDFMGLSLGFDSGAGGNPEGMLAAAGHTISFKEETGLIRVSSAGAEAVPHEGLLFLLRFGIKQSLEPGEHTTINFKLVELEAKVNVSSESDPGHILFASPQESGDVTVPVVDEFPPGDANHSKTTTSFDAVLILKHLVGLPTPPLSNAEPAGFDGFDEEKADVNNDNRVSALDAALIFQKDAGKIAHFPGEATKLVPIAGERVIALSDIKQSGDHLMVPVTLSDLSGLLAGEMSLSYDPSAFGVVGVSPSEQLAGLNVQSHAQDGRLRVAFAGAEAGTGTGDILLVQLRSFKSLHGIGNPITITDVVLNDGMITARVQSDIPKAYALSQNTPNPFNPETQINFDLPKAGHVTLVVYNLSGQIVRTLVSDQRSAGRYTVTWDGQDEHGQAVSSGIYVYKLTSETFTETRKMVLTK